MYMFCLFFFFSSRRRHTRFDCDWSSDVCSSDLGEGEARHHNPGGSRERDGGMTAGAPQGLNLRSLLEEMIEKDASDLHIVAGGRPQLRGGGDIVDPSGGHVLTPKDTLSIAHSVLTE